MDAAGELGLRARLGLRQRERDHRGGSAARRGGPRLGNGRGTADSRGTVEHGKEGGRAPEVRVASDRVRRTHGEHRGDGGLGRPGVINRGLRGMDDDRAAERAPFWQVGNVLPHPPERTHGNAGVVRVAVDNRDPEAGTDERHASGDVEEEPKVESVVGARIRRGNRIGRVIAGDHVAAARHGYRHGGGGRGGGSRGSEDRKRPNDERGRSEAGERAADAQEGERGKHAALLGSGGRSNRG